MRKLLILAAIVAMTIATTQNAEAGRRKRGYTRSRTTYNTSSSRDGIFARLMELERRKNQWLFGR